LAFIASNLLEITSAWLVSEEYFGLLFTPDELQSSSSAQKKKEKMVDYQN
jgi:hypothetical protein